MEKYDRFIRQMKKRSELRLEVSLRRHEQGTGKTESAKSRGCGHGDEDSTRIQFGIPDDQVLLSEDDSRQITLYYGLFSESEEEADQKDGSLPFPEQMACKEKSRKQVLDFMPYKMIGRNAVFGSQATVWELQKDMIRGVHLFRTGRYGKQESFPAVTWRKNTHDL